MAYAIGAAHALSGTGSVAISNPAGLKVVVTAYPLYVGSFAGQPVQYFRLGRLNLGNADGWAPPDELRYLSSLIYPLERVWDRLGYSLADGVNVTVYELVETAPADLIDRHPFTVPMSYVSEGLNNHSSVQRGTYTVPAGKWALINSAQLYLAVSTAGGSLQWMRAWIWLASSSPGGSSYLLRAQKQVQNNGAVAEASMGRGPLLAAGDNVAMYTSSDGNFWFGAALTINLTEFDA